MTRGHQFGRWGRMVGLEHGVGARDENENHERGDFELSMLFRLCHICQVTDLPSGKSGDGLLSFALVHSHWTRFPRVFFGVVAVAWLV